MIFIGEEAVTAPSPIAIDLKVTNTHQPGKLIIAIMPKNSYLLQSAPTRAKTD